MMLVRAVSAGVAALVLASPVLAQQRGTIEFGGFASNMSFDKDLGLNSAWGAGGRVGAFLHPRLSVEFEGGATSASRNFGLGDVNIGVLSSRLTAVALQSGRVSLLLGAGVDHTDSDLLESYGMHGLLGAKMALWNNGDLRVDGIHSRMARGKGTNTGFHVGVSFYRNPFGRLTTVTRTIVGPSVAQRPDSVSASETRRLRAVAASYDALRDSLAKSSKNDPPSSLEALATMQEMIYFRYDYDAEAARAYLVSQGVDQIRIEIATQGEGQLVFEGPSESVNAANRRGQFRLLIADPYLARPKK